MSFLQPLNRVIQKKLIVFPHHTEIRRFLSPSTSLTFLTAPFSVLPDFDSLIHQQEVKEKYEWLESVYGDKTPYWVP